MTAMNDLLKRIVSAAAALAACASLTACSGTTNAASIYSEFDLARVGIVDYLPIESLEQLESYCDTIVVGEVADDPVYDEENEFFSYRSNIRSYSTIEVKQVLMGDVSVNDRITVTQESGIVDDVFYTFSELTPMIKGDEWLFFLVKDDNDVYWVMCDSDGRYPTKNSASKNCRMTFKNAELSDSYQLGVFDEESFNRFIYNEIVEKYNV